MQYADRDFVQYSSAFQLVMTKKESHRSSCPERRLSSALTARKPDCAFFCVVPHLGCKKFCGRMT
jgi:hypothetical protein